MKVASLYLILFAGFIICLNIFPVESTICEPLSSFTMDCNVCRCSKNGREYSCTQNLCLVDYSKQFVQERNQQGYLILKPKKPNTDLDDAGKARKLRHLNIPYYNDAIDISYTNDNNN